MVGNNTKIVQITRNSIYRISSGTECSEKQLVGWEMHEILYQNKEEILEIQEFLDT